MDLYIDTTTLNHTLIKITRDGEDVYSQTFEGMGSETLLPHLSLVIDDRNNFDIKRIFVNTGPGSFTGTRVGVSVANALGYCMNLPINNLPRGVYAKVKYESSKFS